MYFLQETFAKKKIAAIKFNSYQVEVTQFALNSFVSRTSHLEAEQINKKLFFNFVKQNAMKTKRQFLTGKRDTQNIFSFLDVK